MVFFNPLLPIESPTNIQNNEIIISAGKVYSFGGVNGKPLYFSLGHNGVKPID
jgi:hypothetical protein